ncbi:Rap1a/Tai family immunity protein [Cronobacter dublinensis]
MKMLRILAVGLLTWSTLAGAQTTVYEYPRAEDLPEDGTTFLTRDPALLNAFENHLSAARFFSAWSNRQNERERIKADMYFIGVMDATEGILWCPERPSKPGTLRSIAYDYFAKSSPERLKNAQAKTLIVEALKENHACK